MKYVVRGNENENKNLHALLVWQQTHNHKDDIYCCAPAVCTHNIQNM